VTAPQPRGTHPIDGRRWQRHQGLTVTLIVLLLVVGLDLGGAFDREAPARSRSGATRPTAVRGVTDTSIKVVLYQPPESDAVSKLVAQFVAPEDDNAEAAATVRGFINVLAKGNPALHGRSIEVVRFTGSANLLDSVAARADAVKIAEDIRPFAVLNGPLLGTAFADELASRKVLCLLCVVGGSNDFYASHAPYVWSLQTTPEQVAAQVAEYVDKRLVGRRAAFAGERDLRRATRRLGLISVKGPFGAAGLGPSVTTELDRRDVELAESVAYGDANGVNQVQASLIGRLRARGVTTIIYGGDPIALGSLMAEATRQDWFPEWVMTGGFSSERTSWGRPNDPRQMRHAFGVTPLAPPALSPDKDIILRLYRDANGGKEPPAHQSAQLNWAPVFLLFSALGDGSDLTGRGVQRSMFRSEPIGGDPATPYIPLISYGRRGLWPYPDYAGLDDFAEIWWDPTANGRDEFGERGRGMWRFADDARRYVPGSWPSGPPHAFVRRSAVTAVAN